MMLQRVYLNLFNSNTGSGLDLLVNTQYYLYSVYPLYSVHINQRGKHGGNLLMNC